MFIEYGLDFPTIIDTDFREVIGYPKDFSTWGISIELANAVINVYERRRLPVVSNLIKAFQWYNKRLDNPIEFAIHKNKTQNYYNYKKYADEVDKYLILL